MMDKNRLDSYLRAFEVETNHAPSKQFMENILAIPELDGNYRNVNFWLWFDLMIPKAVGWALTCCLGIYLGISSMEQGNGAYGEEYYLYDQAQVMLSESLTMEDID